MSGSVHPAWILIPSSERFLCATSYVLFEKKLVPVEQTMEKQIRKTILFVLLTISALKNYISCMEISLQIVFDSRENKGNSKDFNLRDFLNLNEVHDQITTTQQILKSLTFKINSENELRMLNAKRSDFIEVSKLLFHVCNCLQCVK